MSDWSELSSHDATVARKLRTMMPTATVVATAIMSAASATDVRLSEATMPRAAIRPKTPKIAPATGLTAAAKTRVANGVASAAPTRTSASPPYEAKRLVPEWASHATAKPTNANNDFR